MMLTDSRPGSSPVKNRGAYAPRTLAVIALLIWSSPDLRADTVTATWDRNPETNIAGYILSYGTQSATYTSSLDVGNVTTTQIDLNPGQRYYFVVQAYNTSAQVSPRSAEIFFDVGGVTPAPSITTLAPTSGAVGTVVTIAGASFGATKGTSTVTFNGLVATPTAWSATSLVVPVPAGATTGNVVVTVGGVASNARVFTVTVAVPGSWTAQDVGSPALAGSASWPSGIFTVRGAGVDIWDASDQFQFVYRTLDGDGEIVARVSSLVSTDSWAKAGVMIREDLTPDAPNAMAQVTAGNGPTFQRRVIRDGSTASNQGFAGEAPQWVRLVRSGNTFSGYYSATGTAWILMGSVVVSMPSRAYVGLAVTSHDPSLVTTGTFDNVSVTGAGGTATPPNILTRAPTSGAVGTAVTVTGTNFGATKGTSTVTFNGVLATPTTWSNTSLVVPVPAGATTGNIVITAGGVASNGVAFTVLGAAPSMTSLAPTSGTVGTAVTITGANFGATQGTSTITFNGVAATPTAWSATSLVVPVPAGATTGNVAVTVGGVASNARVFTVTGTVPGSWTAQDVGNPALAGSASWPSGMFTVRGAGVDIWDTSDEFQFVYQMLDGDGEIVARVTTLQDTDSWAKAGVMIRADLTGGAPNATAQVTAGNGLTFQRRVTRDGQSTSDKGFAGVAPQWVRLVRSGNTFSGYYSATGTAWILMGSVEVSMPSRAYVGLAVTSHNPSEVATGTFADVTVTKTTAHLSRYDYDGDGKADGAVWTPLTGTWSIIESRSGTARTVTLGALGDRPVPGDYDGDRETDIAVYRPATGKWSVLLSSTNYGSGFAAVLGSGAAIPVPGDYDGDAKTDIAVYQPTTGQWQVLKSSTNYATLMVTTWGIVGDIPVPGDYDRDGKIDLAVYRPSTGWWRILSSIDYVTSLTVPLGTSTSIPMPGDYDGDAATDIAVYQPTTGQWQILKSTTNYATSIAVQWGITGDIPVGGDYDGDGKMDPSVYRPSMGLWRILQSSTGYATNYSVSWGMIGDIPLPQRP